MCERTIYIKFSVEKVHKKSRDTSGQGLKIYMSNYTCRSVSSWGLKYYGRVKNYKNENRCLSYIYIYTLRHCEGWSNCPWNILNAEGVNIIFMVRAIISISSSSLPLSPPVDGIPPSHGIVSLYSGSNSSKIICVCEGSRT